MFWKLDGGGLAPWLVDPMALATWVSCAEIRGQWRWFVNTIQFIKYCFIPSKEDSMAALLSMSSSWRGVSLCTYFTEGSQKTRHQSHDSLPSAHMVDHLWREIFSLQWQFFLSLRRYLVTAQTCFNILRIGPIWIRSCTTIVSTLLSPYCVAGIRQSSSALSALWSSTRRHFLPMSKIFPRGKSVNHRFRISRHLKARRSSHSYKVDKVSFHITDSLTIDSRHFIVGWIISSWISNLVGNYRHQSLVWGWHRLLHWQTLLASILLVSFLLFRLLLSLSLCWLSSKAFCFINYRIWIPSSNE